MKNLLKLIQTDATTGRFTSTDQTGTNKRNFTAFVFQAIFIFYHYHYRNVRHLINKFVATNFL